jgi:diguanylate cyclase (GGDEF)-like protein
MNSWAMIPLVSCLAYIVLLTIVLQQTRRRVNTIFAIFLFAAASWSFSSFMLTSGFFASGQALIFWNGLVLIGAVWANFAYYHFVRAYTNRSAGIVVYIGYAIILAMLSFCLSGHMVKDVYLVDGYLHHDIGPWLFIMMAILVPLFFVTLWMLVQKYRRSKDPIDRNRTLYLLVGVSIMGMWAAINANVPLLALLPTDHLGCLANALIITYAIGRFQLLDIKLVARRGLAYFILVSALIGVYVGAILLGFNLFPTLPVSSVVVLATALALLLALAARPLRYAIQEGIDRLFYRGTYEHRQTLLSFSSKMGNILNLGELAKEMLPAMTKALNITQASLLLQDIGSGDFTIHFTHPKAKSQLSGELNFSADNPIFAWLEKETSPLDLKQIDGIPEFKGLWQVEKEKLATSNLELLCPIKSRGRLIGILALGRKWSGGLYSHEDIGLVMSLAGQAGIMIENAQLYTQATIRANTDGLTGLYNHRHFHESLEQEIARGTRFGTVFSVVMLDIDLFKAYNDVYGHLAGDQILRRIGELIKSSIRKLDIPFRYGGEEFTVILPEARLDNAYKIAERIRRAIESKASSKAMPVTVSLGVASWPVDGVTREEIIGCADAALYRAKQTGRNRSCLSSDIVKAMTPLVGEELEVRRGALNIIYALAATVDAKDHYTYGHSKKVSEYAVALSEALSLPEDRITTIRAAALLHDIGKIGIPDSILNKEGTLTKEEWEKVKAHPQDGVEILRHVISLVNCLPAILHHHEHYDGNGYPAGLQGDSIPLEARILSIADAYDAITSLRPYHERLSPQQALDELKRCAGTQFDPELVDIFCKAMEPTLVKRLEIK